MKDADFNDPVPAATAAAGGTAAEVLALPAPAGAVGPYDLCQSACTIFE